MSVCRFSFIIFLIVLTTLSNGQGFTDINAPLTGLHMSDAAWGDYDTDGDLDLIIAGLDTFDNGVTQVYRNDGSDTFVELTALTLPGTYIGDIAWGDYDGDGDLDFLLQGYTNTSQLTTLYENTGADNFADSGVALPALADGSVSFADYSNDGHLDILIAGYDGSAMTAILYMNDGAGGFTETSVQFPGAIKSCYEWADYDNDGDLDLFLTGYASTGLISELYDNNGDGSFSLSVNSFTGAWLGDAAWGDYDCDGDLDLLLAGHAATGKIAVLYRNQGDGTFTELLSTGLTGVSHCSTIWGDYDADGDLDVFIGGTWEDGGGWVRVTDVFINNGDDTFTEAGLTFTGDCYWGESAWGDYDGDGDLDLVCCGFDDLGGSNTRIYRRNGTSNTVPSIPGSIQHAVVENEVTLSWNPSTDAETPSAGLTYNACIRNESGYFIWPSMSDISTGTRTLPAPGNAMQNTSWSIGELPQGDYRWTVQALDNNFAGSPFAIEDTFTITAQGIEGSGLPWTFELLENSPDPFRTTTSIIMHLSEPGHVRVAVYSSDGRLIRSLSDCETTAGTYRMAWDGSDDSGFQAGSGIYFIRLEVDGKSAWVEKCTLLR